MIEYSWKFVRSGGKNKKITFMLMCDKNKIDELNDVNWAAHTEQSYIDKGIIFNGPTIKDFLVDSRKSVEASHAGKDYTHKVQRIDIHEFKRFLKGG